MAEGEGSGIDDEVVMPPRPDEDIVDKSAIPTEGPHREREKQLVDEEHKEREQAGEGSDTDDDPGPPPPDMEPPTPPPPDLPDGRPGHERVGSAPPPPPSPPPHDEDMSESDADEPPPPSGDPDADGEGKAEDGAAEEEDDDEAPPPQPDEDDEEEELPPPPEDEDGGAHPDGFQFENIEKQLQREKELREAQLLAVKSQEESRKILEQVLEEQKEMSRIIKEMKQGQTNKQDLTMALETHAKQMKKKFDAHETILAQNGIVFPEGFEEGMSPAEQRMCRQCGCAFM